jgi:hypothetical protein
VIVQQFGPSLTVGVEEELWIVDAETLQLVPALETLGGPFDHDVASASRADLPDPDLPADVPGDPTNLPGSAVPAGPPVPAAPAPAPGDAADPWRDLPPGR